MKVSELSGAHLDFWVAKAEGMDHPPFLREMAPGCCVVKAEGRDDEGPVMRWVAFQPSISWTQAGPIIDDNAIGFHPISDAEWMAEEHITARTGRGQTPLIAAMRAYVASKFGDEVADVEGAA